MARINVANKKKEGRKKGKYVSYREPKRRIVLASSNLKRLQSYSVLGKKDLNTK